MGGRIARWGWRGVRSQPQEGRIVGKDIPSVCKLYRRFIFPFVFDLSSLIFGDTLKGIRNLTERSQEQSASANTTESFRRSPKSTIPNPISFEAGRRDRTAYSAELRAHLGGSLPFRKEPQRGCLSGTCACQRSVGRHRSPDTHL